MGTEESPSVPDDAADEIMDRIVKSATQVPSQRVVPRERKRSRANRKSREYISGGWGCFVFFQFDLEGQKLRRKLPSLPHGSLRVPPAFLARRRSY